MWILCFSLVKESSNLWKAILIYILILQINFIYWKITLTLNKLQYLNNGRKSSIGRVKIDKDILLSF